MNMNFDSGHAHRPVCGPYACHVLTKRSMSFIMSYFKKHYVPRRYNYCKESIDRWKGGSPVSWVLGFLRRSRKVTEIKFDSKTCGKFVDYETTKKEKYLIYVSRHYVSVVNGYLIDQSGHALPYDHWCSRKRPKRIWKITSKPKRRR